MKIGFVSTLQPDTSYFRYLALALQTCGHDVRVYADRNSKNLEVGLKNVFLLWAPGDRLYPLHILRQALRDRPMIIHLHHEVGMFGGPINASIFPFVPFLLWLFGFKVITTIHAVVSPEDINTGFLQIFAWPPKNFLVLPVKLYFFILNWVIVLFSRKVIVHAVLLKKQLVEGYHCPESKLVVISHGVPDTVEHSERLISASAWTKLLGDAPFVLYFGYLHRRKGLETLLRSWLEVTKHSSPVKLVLAGGALQPQYEEDIKRMIREWRLENSVVLTGFVTQAELRYLLDRCLFAVMPAIHSIAASGPLAQVIAHEKPVIVSRVGVLREEITEGVNGLFAEVGSVQSWSEQMHNLLTDPVLLARLHQGMTEFHQQRVWPKIASLTLKVYEDALR